MIILYILVAILPLLAVLVFAKTHLSLRQLGRILCAHSVALALVLATGMMVSLPTKIAEANEEHCVLMEKTTGVIGELWRFKNSCPYALSVFYCYLSGEMADTALGCGKNNNAGTYYGYPFGIRANSYSRPSTETQPYQIWYGACKYGTEELGDTQFYYCRDE